MLQDIREEEMDIGHQLKRRCMYCIATQESLLRCLTSAFPGDLSRYCTVVNLVYDRALLAPGHPIRAPASDGSVAIRS
jgi:hypothetical protein